MLEPIKIIHTDVLACPFCGGEYLHHDQITVANRFREDAPGLITILDNKYCKTIYSDSDLDFMGRRHGIEIKFICEQCPDKRFTLNLRQHKGSTLLFWTK